MAPGRSTEARPPPPPVPPIWLPHPERAHLSGWALGGGVGAGSIKTCSVRGPGRTAAASASLGPASGTSVASVASSVDGAGLTFPLVTAGTSPVEGRGERRRPQAWLGTHPGPRPAPRCPQGPGLTLALVQHRGVPRAQDSPWPLSSTGVSPREEQLLRGTLQRVAQPTSVMPASTPSAPESSGFTSLSRKISPGG